MNNITNKGVGDEGEDMAADLLVKKGYEIIERKYRFGKGEIDIIAKDPKTNYTVFIEVKLKKNLEFGEPEYQITKRKISQIKRMAAAYLYDKEIAEIDCRFDVVTILKIPRQKTIINHYVNAFD